MCIYRVYWITNVSFLLSFFLSFLPFLLPLLQVSIKWKNDWFQGTVDKYNPLSNEHHVTYSDGDSRWYTAGKTMFKNPKGSHAYKVLEYGEAMKGVNDEGALEEAKLQPLTVLGDHFDLLFDLLNIGSQRVLEQAWALLALLPTNQGLLERLKGCNGEMDWDAILPLDRCEYVYMFILYM